MSTSAASTPAPGTPAPGTPAPGAPEAVTGPGTVHRADLLVIGGGMIGLAIAWRSAQRGMTVLLADPRPATGASHAAAGMLTPVAEAAYAERELFELGSRSLAAFGGFAAELTELTGLDVGLRQSGTLAVGYDADDMAMLAEHAVLRESFGVPTRRLTGRECRGLEPMLGPGISGGLLVTDDSSVDPRLLAAALLAAIPAAGAVHLPRAVTTIRVAGGRAVGAELDDGTVIEAGRVVLSAGWSSGAIAGLPPGAAPPLRPVKGQILRLRPTAALSAGGAPLLTRTVRGIVQGSPVYLVPRGDGELVLGATQEELGPDTTVTAGGVWQLLRDARALVPGITEFELAEAIAALRPGTPDNAPVLGPSALPGLVLATGHFRGGVLLAPVTAEIIVGYLETGTLPAYAEAFLAERFTPAASAGRAGGAR